LGVRTFTSLAALDIGRFVQALLFNLDAHDVPTMVAAAAVLTGVALIAGWLPARRAARIDPAQVLRDAWCSVRKCLSFRASNASESLP
jgi:ABC-type lipoprotein release transport system permease subunit